MDFDLLPLELKYQILSNLTHEELHTKVARVSEYWNDISQTPYIKKHISVTGRIGCETREVDDDFAPSLLSTGNNNSKWTCTCCQYAVFGHGDHDILELLKRYYRVRSISFSYITSWNWTRDILDHIHLRELRLCSSEFDSKRSLFMLIKKFPLLQSLTLSRLHFVNNDCMDLPVESKYLKYIRLKIDHKQNDHSCHCLDFVTVNCENLQEFRFSSKSPIAETSIVKFREEPMHSLKKMTLRSKQMIHQDAQLFIWQNQLIHLVIPHTNILDDNGLLVIRNLLQLQSLTVRSSGFLFATNNFVALFAEIIFPCLTEVCFSGCQLLNDEVVDAIIESCPALEILSLTDCMVSVLKAEEIRDKFDAEMKQSSSFQYGAYSSTTFKFPRKIILEKQN